MQDKITLVVRFRISESAKKEFTAKLRDVFNAHRKGRDVRRGLVSPGYA
jgi:hypothetical protein